LVTARRRRAWPLFESISVELAVDDVYADALGTIVV
jgi:hypothetical protein